MRPITLLPEFGKTIARMLAARISKVSNGGQPVSGLLSRDRCKLGPPGVSKLGPARLGLIQ